jgi:hypothetical protein
MGERRDACRLLMWRPEERSPLIRFGVGGRIILKCIFKKWDGGNMDWITLAQERNRSRTSYIK